MSLTGRRRSPKSLFEVAVQAEQKITELLKNQCPKCRRVFPRGFRWHVRACKIEPGRTD